MDAGLSAVLRNNAISGWNLFWLVTGPISIAMVIAMVSAEPGTG